MHIVRINVAEMKKIIIYASIVIGVLAVSIFLMNILKGDKTAAPIEEPQVVQSGEEIPSEEVPSADIPPSAPSAPSTENNNEEETKMTSKYLVTLKTSLGEIVFETYDSDAPKTVDNFITLAKKGFYNGVIFHRVIDGFMIQGGDPTGTGRGGPGYSFEDELDPATDSYKKGYVKGTVAMANSGPDTNGSQFFIMVDDVPLPHSYTIFGTVVMGQDIADKIALVPRDRDDRPLTPVVINEVAVSGK